MQIGLRRISSDTVEWFKAACLGKVSGRPSRSAMASELCERENWRGAGGGLCSASARKLPPKLAESPGAELPAPGAQPSCSHCRPESGYPDKALACGLAALGEVSVNPCRRASAGAGSRWSRATIPRAGPRSRRPDSLLDPLVAARDSRWRGLRRRRLPAGASRRLSRPGADARMANIGLAVCNSRLPLLSGVRVHGLVSQALRLSANRLGEDWARPALAYSSAGPDHSGPGYSAAGWERCAEKTSGRRSGERLAVWIKPLEEGWKKRLCREPRRAARRWAGPGWRARARRCRPSSRARRSSGPAYCLLSNGKAEMEHVPEPHCQATAERCRLEKLVLAARDTTKLNYDGLE